MEKKKKFQFPLNIQLFAEEGEGGDKGGNNDNPKTYSQEEYEKLKASFDKASSEIAQMKKEAKAKLSEDEKKKAEQEEKDTRLKELEDKVLTSEMTAELMESGLEKTSISKIVDSFKGGDATAFSKVLATEIKTFVEKVKKDAQAEFQKNGTNPPAGNGKQEDSFIKDLWNNKHTGNKDAREYYLGKK